MIAKCQRSIVTTEPGGQQLLIYNRTREWIWSGDISTEWDELFEAGEFKFYAEVQWRDGRTPPRFVKRVSDPHWSNRPGEVREWEGHRGDSRLDAMPNVVICGRRANILIQIVVRNE